MCGFPFGRDRVPARAQKEAGGGGRDEMSLALEDEKALDALLLAREEHRLLLERASGGLTLVEELVVVVRPATGDLARPRDLEPLGRGLVRFDLGHLSS